MKKIKETWLSLNNCSKISSTIIFAIIVFFVIQLLINIFNMNLHSIIFNILAIIIDTFYFILFLKDNGGHKSNEKN